MPQMRFHVADDLAETLRQVAKAKGLTVSKYVASLIEKAVRSEWPEGYFEEVVGGWRGPVLRRPPQGRLDDLESV